MDDMQRKSKWRRNRNLETLLNTLDGYTSSIELPNRKASPRIGLVCGAPRSGTSVIIQSLASTGFFAYPSNMISRFYNAPYIGAIAQKLYTDEQMDVLGEFEDLRSGLQAESFLSDLGKTKGALGVNEFWYFWRRFFSFEDGEIQRISSYENDKIERFLNELAAWQLTDPKPIVMKGIMANWNLLSLATIMDNAHFVVVRRDPVENAISLLRARELFFGDRNIWYSFKLPNDCRLPTINPLEEVALQVACHDVLMDQQCRSIDEKRYTLVTLDEFLQDPQDTVRRLAGKILGVDEDSIPDIKKRPRIQPSDKVGRAPASEAAVIQQAYDEFCRRLIPIAERLYGR